MDENPKPFDVFISHASEDKSTFVRPLAIALRNIGVAVWYDEFELRPGTSLSRSIDSGLKRSRFGIVVVSRHFVRKPWPEYELRGLVNREMVDEQMIIPLWHEVTVREVSDFSPPLADKVAIATSGKAVGDVAIELLRVIRPDLYSAKPKDALERLAAGEPMHGVGTNRASILPGAVVSSLPVAILSLSIRQGAIVGARPTVLNERACDR